MGLRAKLGNDVLVFEVEDADGRLRSRAKPVAIWRKADLVNWLIARQLIKVLSTGQVPQAARTVLSCRCAKRAIGGHGHGVDVSGVATKGFLALVSGCAPNFYCVVPAARDDERNLHGRREPDAADPVGVPIQLQSAHPFALDIPHDQLMVTATGDDLAVVWGKRNGKNILGVAVELLDCFASTQIPEAKGGIPRG